MKKTMKTWIGAGTSLGDVTRRDFLVSSAMTAGLFMAARKLFPSGAYAATAAPEVTGAKLRKLMSWINAKEVD